MADQQRARALFGLALNATAVVGWAALLLLFRIHPPEPRHPGLVVVVALMRCLVSLYLRHSATPWQPRAAVSEPSMMSLLGTFLYTGHPVAVARRLRRNQRETRAERAEL